MDLCKTLTVHWLLTPKRLQIEVLLQWTLPGTEDPIYYITIQLQQCGCCPYIGIKVFKAHKEPYHMKIESDSMEYESLQCPQKLI